LKRLFGVHALPRAKAAVLMRRARSCYGRFGLAVPITALVLGLAGQLGAQTFKTVYTFTATAPYPNSTNSDGAGPNSLVLSGNTLYGTAGGGGSGPRGTVFSLNTDGSGFTTLYSFTAIDTSTGSPYFNSDGIDPTGVILSGTTLYGTAGFAGPSGFGTVFTLNTDGSGFTTLHNFSGSVGDGSLPSAGVILSGGTLYGTTYGGGCCGSDLGVVFAVNTDGTGFTDLYTFTTDHEMKSELTLSGNTLYGTTTGGGIYLNGGGSGFGTVFNVNTDGTGFTPLHQFTPVTAPHYTNSDGVQPAGVILSGNTLYGTALYGGNSGNGTIFKVNTDGTGFMSLYRFTSSNTNSSGVWTNSDGAYPQTVVIVSGNTLYGTCDSGGPWGNGTIFAVNTDGTGFRTLYGFSATSSNSFRVYTNSDGSSPHGLILSGNTLYGVTGNGGSGGSGTIFSISLPVAPPQLTIIPAGGNVILTWPTNATGFTLQSTTNFGSSAIWMTNSPAQVVINGQNTVTNPISGTQQFYRLTQ